MRLREVQRTAQYGGRNCPPLSQRMTVARAIAPFSAEQLSKITSS